MNELIFNYLLNTLTRNIPLENFSYMQFIGNNKQISNFMLDWCRNLQHSNQSQSELVFTTQNNAFSKQMHLHLHKNEAPKFIGPYSNKISRFEPNSRKGIKTHFNKSLKANNKVQFTLEVPIKKLVDSCTQTSRLTVQNAKYSEKKVSRMNSRENSPLRQNESNGGELIENSKREELTNTLMISKRKSVDYKIEIYKQTKATNCLVQSKDKSRFYVNHDDCSMKNIESYHVSSSKREQQNQKIEHPFILYRHNMPPQYEPKMVQSIKNIDQSRERTSNHDYQEYDDLVLTSKYKNMMRNVQSQFKYSDRKQSQRKFRHTPNRKILFHDRQTIVSRQNQQFNDADPFYRVEESILYEPQIRSMFTPMSQILHYQTFTLFLACQNLMNLGVSIKQVSVDHMNNISQEILIYKQLEHRNIIGDGLLQLYQSQIDGGTYMFIKQPYTLTLEGYLHQTHDPTEIVKQLKQYLIKMQQLGFTLRRQVKVQDLVIVFGKVKIHNVGIFQTEAIGLDIESTMFELRQQILHYLI